MPLITITLKADDGGTAQLSQAFEWVYPPEMFSITPARGPITGGSTHTIMGRHLRADHVVDFDGRVATIVSVSSDGTKMVVIAPAGV